MKKLIVSIIILTLTTSSLFAHVEHYKSFNNLNFELFRNGKLIGYHNYEFIRENRTLKVVSDVEFNINKLGVNLYSYKATSEEIYKNNRSVLNMVEKFKSGVSESKTGMQGASNKSYYSLIPLSGNVKSEKKTLDIVDQVLKTCEELDKQNSVKT